MKRFLFITIAFLFSLTMYGQHKHDMGKKMMKDCVMMEDGKMMVYKQGNSMAMDKDMTMHNGTIVMPDGQVKMKNGKTKMLKDGDCVYLDGRMGHMHMSKMEKDKM